MGGGGGVERDGGKAGGREVEQVELSTLTMYRQSALMLVRDRFKLSRDSPSSNARERSSS